MILLYYLDWLFLLSFCGTKSGVHPFKAGVCLLEQTLICCKQVTTCFKLVHPYSEGVIFFLFEILVCKINLNNLLFEKASVCFETCTFFFKTGFHRFLCKQLSVLNRHPSVFNRGRLFWIEVERSTCFIQANAYLNQTGVGFKTGGLLYLKK